MRVLIRILAWPCCLASCPREQRKSPHSRRRRGSWHAPPPIFLLMPHLKFSIIEIGHQRNIAHTFMYVIPCPATCNHGRPQDYPDWLRGYVAWSLAAAARNKSIQRANSGFPPFSRNFPFKKVPFAFRHYSSRLRD